MLRDSTRNWATALFIVASVVSCLIVNDVHMSAHSIPAVFNESASASSVPSSAAVIAHERAHARTGDAQWEPCYAVER